MASGAKNNQAVWNQWDFDLQLAAHRVPFVAGVSKYGFNSAIIDATEDVWSNGGVLSFLSSAETMNIASGDAADKGTPTAGTGARTIEIFGVDANYIPISETVTLNGTTNVLTTNAFLRVNRMRVASVGSGGVNAGAITATASTAATVQASIPADSGSTFKCQYTVPAGYTAFIRSINYGALNNDQVQFDFQTRAENESWITRDRVVTVENFIPPPFKVPIKVSEKSDIRVQAIRASGSGTIQVSTRYAMHLVNSNYINNNSIVVDET